MNNMTFLKLKALTLMLVFSLYMPTQAQEAHEFYATMGWLYLAPQSNSTPIKLVQSGATPMNTELTGTGVRLGTSNTLGISGGYFFTDHWAIEFTAGIPPPFKIRGWGTLDALGHIAKTTAWTPILQAKYRRAIITPALKASLAVGATYCWFTNSTIENPALDQMLGGPTGLVVGGAFRPVFSGGLTYALAKNWFVGGTFSYIPMNVTGTLDTQNQATQQVDTYKVGVDLNPIMTYLSLGYVFNKRGQK